MPGDVLIGHTKVSAKSDGADATQIQPSDWNASHPLSGGVLGDVLIRDTGATKGATWITPGTAGKVLTSNGVGVASSFQPGTGGSYIAKTANYTAVAGDVVAVTANSITITLPAASANANQVVRVVNNGTGTVTIGRTGADTVGLATSQTLNPATASAQGDAMTFISDGVSNWNIF